MASAWVVKVVTGKRRAPVAQHADELSRGDIGRHQVLGHVRQAKALQGGVEPRSDRVEHELAIDADLQLAPFFSNSQANRPPYVGRRTLMQLWFVRSCAGFWTPASRAAPLAPAAGVQKAPGHEVAGSLGAARAAGAMGI